MTMQVSTEPDVLSVDGFLDWYSRHHLNRSGRHPSPATLQSKRTFIEATLRNLSFTPDALAGALAHKESVGWVVGHLTTSMTPGAARGYVYAYQDYAAYARSLGVIESIAVGSEDLPPENNSPPLPVYTEEELERLVGAAWGRSNRFGSLLEFLVQTSRRIGEALSIEWDWVHLTATPPHVTLPMTKGGRPEFVPLSEQLVERVFAKDVVALIKDESFRGRIPITRPVDLHPWPWSYATERANFKRLCLRLGVEYYGLHNIRHSVITHRLAKGWPVQAVSALAGHASVQTTDMMYNHTTALSYAGMLNEQ